MGDLNIREYLRNESAFERFKYGVAELGLSDFVNNYIEELANSYEKGELTELSLFGMPERTERPLHEVALDKLKREIIYQSRREYFSQMTHDDALTICRGFYALQHVKGALFVNVQVDTIGEERISPELFLSEFNAFHPDDPIKFHGPCFEN